MCSQQETYSKRQARLTGLLQVSTSFVFLSFQMKTGIMTVGTTAGCITTNPVCVQPMIAVRPLRQIQAIATHLSLAKSFLSQWSNLASEAKLYVDDFILDHRGL
jgi:hypothetical protein